MSDPLNSSFGVVTGTANALPFPSVRADWARIKNNPSGVLGFIGTYGFANYPLATGEDTGWFSEDDMGQLYYRGTGAYFSYWI